MGKNRLTRAEIARKTTNQYLLAALSLLLLGVILFLVIYFRQRRKWRDARYLQAIRDKLNEILHLKSRISDILDSKRDSIRLQPFDELNELMATPLTGKEYEVLQDVAAGKTNREIAKIQYISENTVKYHLKNIYSKLDVGNRKEALQAIVTLTL